MHQNLKKKNKKYISDSCKRFEFSVGTDPIKKIFVSNILLNISQQNKINIFQKHKHWKFSRNIIQVLKTYVNKISQFFPINRKLYLIVLYSLQKKQLEKYQLKLLNVRYVQNLYFRTIKCTNWFICSYFMKCDRVCLPSLNYFI